MQKRERDQVKIANDTYVSQGPPQNQKRPSDLDISMEGGQHSGTGIKSPALRWAMQVPKYQESRELRPCTCRIVLSSNLEVKQTSDCCHCCHGHGQHCHSQSALMTTVLGWRGTGEPSLQPLHSTRYLGNSSNCKSSPLQGLPYPLPQPISAASRLATLTVPLARVQSLSVDDLGHIKSVNQLCCCWATETQRDTAGHSGSRGATPPTK